MNSPQFLIQIEQGVATINGQTLKQMLESPKAKSANCDPIIERCFERLLENMTFSELFLYLKKNGIEPVRQILILQALSQWSLRDAKAIFDTESDYWD